jgi:hypothetical protein
MDRAGMRGEHEYRERAACRPLVPRSPATLGDAMMEPYGWPLDAVSAAALVARVIHDIDRSSEHDRDVLLSDLLCVAWPSHCAQDH